MNDNLKVSLENIIPLTFARDHFSQIVSEVQKDKLFVLTKGGKPAVAIIDVKYLESITGGQIQKADIKEEIKKAPEKVGLPPMVEHPSSVPFKPMTPPPPPAKPFDSAPSTPLGTSQGKPAGFAAPRPSSGQAPSFASSDAKAMEDKKATEGKPPPQPAPSPKPSSPPPPPPIPKPEPKPFDSAPSTPLGTSQGKPTPPPAPKSEPQKPTPSTLVMPGEKPFDSAQGKPAAAPTAIPNKPLTTLPPVGQTNQVNVEFAPDEATLAKQTAEDKVPNIEKAAPDDKNSPAQYAGEKEKEPEPEDMALD